MTPQTQTKFIAFCQKMASTYGIDTVSNFTLTPPKAVKMNELVQESTDFLKRVSLVPSTEIKGLIFDLDVGSTIASRTTGARSGKKIGAKDGRSYECNKTNYDVAIPYAQLDAMAVFSDFNQRLVRAVNTRIALDRLLIGWNGTSCAETTNSETNSALQDVNTGWLYDLKTNMPTNFIETAKIGKGATADYKNLDHVVGDLIKLIPIEHRGGLVCLVGNELIADDMARVYAQYGTTPSEKEGFKIASQRYGNLETITPSGFPERAVMVVNPKNLQIYFQTTSVRKMIVDEPKFDCITHYTSMNDCYRLARLEAAACIANLTEQDA